MMKMRHIFAATLIVLLCASIADPASARTFRDPYGGRGDASASDECGPGKYFVGVVGATRRVAGPDRRAVRRAQA